MLIEAQLFGICLQKVYRCQHSLMSVREDTLRSQTIADGRDSVASRSQVLVYGGKLCPVAPAPSASVM